MQPSSPSSANHKGKKAKAIGNPEREGKMSAAEYGVIRDGREWKKVKRGTNGRNKSERTFGELQREGTWMKMILEAIKNLGMSVPSGKRSLTICKN